MEENLSTTTDQQKRKENEIVNQILGSFEQDSTYKEAFMLWCNYYFSTEEYDRSVCSIMGHFGFEPTAIPTTPEEYYKVNLNANQRMAFLHIELAEKQISKEVSIAAKKSAGRLTHEQLREIVYGKNSNSIQIKRD